MQDEAASVLEATVVGDLALKEQGVRYDDFLVLRRAQVRHQKPNLGDFADVIRDRDNLAYAKRPTVRERVARDDARHERRRAKRKHESRKDRDALKGSGAGAGKVWVGDNR